MNGSTDVADCCVVMEETPTRMLGVDEYGNQVAADPYLKARMTAGYSTTMSQERGADGGVTTDRKSRVYIARMMHSLILITNDNLPSHKSAIMSRFIPYVMHKMTREDMGGEDRTFALNTEDGGIASEGRTEALEGAQLQHYYVLLWEKSIESGALPDIDTQQVRIVAGWIFNELAKRGVPRPARRHMTMLELLCRIAQMLYGAHMEFMSEYGHHQRMCLAKEDLQTRQKDARDMREAADVKLVDAERREQSATRAREDVKLAEADANADASSVEDLKKRADEADASATTARTLADTADRDARLSATDAADGADVAGTDKAGDIPFQPWMLANLVKWSVVTQEVVVFVMSLLEFLWVPKVRAEIAHALGKLARCQKAGDASGLIFVESMTNFRREFDTDDASADANAGSALDGGGAGASGGGGGGGGDAFSTGGGGVDYRYVEVTGSSYVQIGQKVTLFLDEPPSDNDVLSTLNAMATEYVSCKRKHFVTDEMETSDFDYDLGQPVLQRVRVLADVPGSTEDIIPMVIFDTLSDRQASRSQQYRISIAVTAVNQDFSTVFKDSVKAALSHRYQSNAEFITGDGYKYVRPSGGDGGDGASDAPAPRREQADIALHYASASSGFVMHNVFDTVKITRDPKKVQYVQNMYGRTQNEINVMLRRLPNGAKAKQIKKMRLEQAPMFVVKGDLDTSALMRYWRAHGVPVSSVGPAFTPHAQNYMKMLYDESGDMFKTVTKTMVKSYPLDWVKHIEERRTVAMDKANASRWAADTIDTVSAHVDIDEEAAFRAILCDGLNADGEPIEAVEADEDAVYEADLANPVEYDPEDEGARLRLEMSRRCRVRRQEQQQRTERSDALRRRHGEVDDDSGEDADDRARQGVTAVTRILFNASVSSGATARKRARLS